MLLSVTAMDNAWVSSVHAADGDGGLSAHIIDTVSPSHVKFNLFDYWVDTPDSRYNLNWSVQGGINQGHPFVFSDGGTGRGPWNVWTGNGQHYNATHQGETRYGVYPGIVNTLLQDGYPALALDDDYPQKGSPEFIAKYNLQGKLTESLAYLFDPDVENDYKAVYENVQGLVKYDGNGGYVYNSHENYAVFQESDAGILGTNGEPSDGSFDVYDNWGLTSGGSPNGQFFPFDGADEVFATDKSGNYQVGSDGKLVPRTNVSLDGNTTLNHYMGLTMDTVFLQPEDGKIDEATPMSFTFSGDDDVWIFIDNVLVSDLGGIHDECFTIIDFEKGTVYTGLTPMVENQDGSFTQDIPTLEELRTNGAGMQTWTWFDRTQDSSGHRAGTKTGDYAAFAAAHNIRSITLKAIFEAAGLSDTEAWGDGTENGMSADTFDQNTQHELKMFYLERGAGASNLVLEFNMLAVPASGITKTDQDGRPVSGAEFTLWPAQVDTTGENLDEYGFPAPVIDEATGLYVADKSGAPICTAATDENGHLNFVTENRKIISFQERAQDVNNPQLYYVLEETKRPTGYRSKGDISLYYSIYNRDTREGVLLSYNYWQTGAYTQAMLDVTMTPELYEYAYDATTGKPVAGTQIGAGREDIDEYLDNGIVFAVPIKRMDMEGSLYAEENYHAIYGTINTGWTLMTEDITQKASVLEAARGMMEAMRQTRQSGTIIAERNARQLFQVTVTNIPGDVKLSYPYLMQTEAVGNSEYNIAFYFAPNAQTLDDIKDPDSIVRIATTAQDDERFVRQYASQFYVSNTFNRLRVQKLDYRGNRLEGATFHMYQTYSTWARPGYVLVEQGSADTAHVGMYRNPKVVNEDGALCSRADILANAETWDKGTTLSEGSIDAGGLDLDGAVIFPTAFDKYIYGNQTDPYRIDLNDTSTYMEEGEYLIYEAAVPAGYTINETPIAVTVNDDGVFADAGEINDGVRVGQYAGWVLNSMSQFAAESAVDETLTFINTTLMVRGSDGLQAPEEGRITWLNKYSNENHRYIFFAEDMGYYVTAGRNLYQFTDAGTPQLLVKQNSSVTAKALILDGQYKKYSGIVTVNKRNADGTLYTLQGIATNGTLAFWLRKGGTSETGQTLDSVQIDGVTLACGTDYHVYDPRVQDLSGYDDLSGLFSVETLVQVYNQNVGDLEVSKNTEQVAAGSKADEEIFYYRVYGVYERATQIVLAQDKDGDGHADMDSDGQPILDTQFTGTLNVRLHEEIPDVDGQAAATNVAVDFTDGVGLLYLEPEYNVEYVYIPENEEHGAYGLVGLVDTRITLDDQSVNGIGTVTMHHLVFSQGSSHTHTHSVLFENGVGTLYRNPDFAVGGVQVGGVTYTPGAETNGVEVTERFHYTTIQQILNMDTTAEAAVVFTEADGSPSLPDRVIVSSTSGPGQNVTIKPNGNGGYSMAYSLGSDTHIQAVVAQFALYAGQTIHISGLGGGTTYYVYEYAADEDGRASYEALADGWATQIEITPQGAQNGHVPITDNYEAVIQDDFPEYRAATGIIRTNATQKVVFTNSGRVGSLTVSKTVTGDQATDIDRQKAFPFTVTLKDADGAPLKGAYRYTGGATDGVAAPADGILTLDADGSATFNLIHGQSITISNIPKDTVYTVSEGDASGYTVTVEGDTDADGIANGTIVENQTVQAAFTNLKLSALTFTKVASENHAILLPGAKFALYRLDCADPGSHGHSDDLVQQAGGCWSLIGTQTSSETGEVSFGELEAGCEYRLVETKAPDGRVLPEGQWRVVTDANNSMEITAVSGQSGRLPPAFATGNSGELLLPNAGPIAIPTSGGFGVRPFLLGGGLLMLTAAGIFIGKRLREKRAALK